MSVVYLEDIVKIVGNKYLAIHIAGLRARQLNKKGGSPLYCGCTPETGVRSHRRTH
jgi:DNA-directed RNA polymerase omega subunit